MKRILVPTTSGSDWQRLLGKPKLHWKRGCSAMSAAACWEANEPNLPPELVDLLAGAGERALRDLKLLLAIPEWDVELPGGDHPSQTDILAICGNDLGLVILGVEAKVNERFGPTLGEKRKDASAGQLERIVYLERLIGKDVPFDDAIRYQLLHRTASAVLTARDFHAPVAAMIVQSFSPKGRWRQDFDAFLTSLSAQPITKDLFEIPSNSEPRLLAGWCKGGQQFLEVEVPSAL